MRQTPWGEHGNGFLPQKGCGSSIPHRFGDGRDNEPAFCRTRKRRVRQSQHPGKNRGQKVNGRKHECFFLSKLRAWTSDPRHRVTGLKPTFPSLYDALKAHGRSRSRESRTVSRADKKFLQNPPEVSDLRQRRAAVSASRSGVAGLGDKTGAGVSAKMAGTFVPELCRRFASPPSRGTTKSAQQSAGSQYIDLCLRFHHDKAPRPAPPMPTKRPLRRTTCAPCLRIK